MPRARLSLAIVSETPAIDADDLRRYAELVLDVGVAFPPGKELAINACLEHAPLVHALCEQAYARGASYVDVWYWDPHTKASRLRHAPTETLAHVPAWLDERYRLLGERQGAIVNVIGESEPALLRDADPERAGLDRMPRISSRFKVQLEGRVEFTTVPYPTAGWAERVLGRPDAAALWQQFRVLLRLDAQDAAAAWHERLDLLERRCRTLDERHFDSLRYEGPGTDFRMGLHERHVWHSARVRSRAGLRHVPAMPTEEIFSMPDPRRAEGTIASTKPLELGGAVVEGLRLSFAGGEVVRADADRGAEVVRANLAMDAGASRLGEVALVDGSSRIARSGLTYWNTLLDESAVCHLAWGATIPDSHADYDAHDPDSARGLGLNESATHVDFMVGGPEVTVFGVHADGREVVLLANDEWQLEE